MLERFMRRSSEAALEIRHTNEIPYEVEGISEEGDYIRQIVWARGVNEARKLAANVRGVADALRLRATELVRDATGGIARAANGNPVHKYED